MTMVYTFQLVIENLQAPSCGTPGLSFLGFQATLAFKSISMARSLHGVSMNSVVAQATRMRIGVNMRKT